jgi:hypothetical protein
MSDTRDFTPAAGWFDDGHGMLRWWDGTAWTEEARPMSGGPDVTTKTTKAGASTWIVGGLVSLVFLIAMLNGSFGALFICAGIVGLLTGLYVFIFNRRSWVRVLPSRRAGAYTAALAIVAIVVGAAISPAPVSGGGTVALPSQSMPSGAPVSDQLVSDMAGKTSAEAGRRLESSGFDVDYVTEDGVSVDAGDDWLVTSQTPEAGTKVPAGARVTLTMEAPSEEPPAVAVAPTPLPAPPVASPAPAPAAPAPIAAPAPAPAPIAAPAPAPIAAPAPAPAPAAVVPGAFCPDALVGSSGVAANGRTYICGGKGADANGKHHWNTTT